MHVDDMHWHLWEAIVLQARDMYSKGLVSKGLDIEVTAITRETVATGEFSEDLRTRACLVAQALEPNAEEWQKAVAIEYEEMNREAEMYERDYRLQQGVSKGADLHCFGA
ncbi:hypothetical protein CB7_160 [Pectobacterium phage vB_PatM_CB7]|uniref:Uncharacterized protein n=1 Tax=Pectobacterium phage phiTE TaxID=1116482 RepID=K9L4Z6_9CAUD|nr:hypothetical protein [Pectobacterium atrosepticum]YP_007392577.1 hypothetical protein phiTE_115 [Pectobacterium phage phiTE]AEZ66281.1 hypothetical protein phiTE_115 [Pectobacterium phage phiTE]ARB11718.1 hypothetical protein CB7_160 [Pectobacterium phage vB_PatM_CB7]